MGKGVAVFDYDGTLIKIDSTKLIIILCFLLSPYRFIKLYIEYLKNNKNKCISEYILSNTIKGKKYYQVMYVFSIYKIICKKCINRIVLKKLLEIKRQGYSIIIASASPVFAIKLIFPNIIILGHDYQIINNIYTGKTNNKMPIKQEKLKQLIEYINRLGFNEIEIAYSDSINDEPLLNYANKSYLIKKGKIEVWKEKYEK